jgi:hypothetical protein
MIYQKTVPEPIFKVYIFSLPTVQLLTSNFQLIIDLTNLDVSTPSSPTAKPAEESDAAESNETSPTQSGPPSETSSHEWDKL